ncbi:LuxR C-terminal-related transcriptional regulator [Nocardioides bruguierae]|uniref:LuxR C-terminal-related transcriptional regulator n=1 Tax=Nocardioides bruguierae TaxID=2945102 RepID=A0A9X2IHQ9_9ACTN|nr:LuxR C-terminal-related transcriptional regulator [Nocardioides bruguierae]MCM0622060.1 LuxR C-terminal-related transcriptional regulator [Nocardioides bruguierae]
MQVARGAWDEADRQLSGVLAQLADSRRSTRLAAAVQLGELRRRQGRWDEALALFGQAEFVPAAIAGAAWIRMARGDAAGAWRAVEPLLRRLPADAGPSRLAVLPLATDVALAVGRRTTAQDLADELGRVAEQTGATTLRATAETLAASLAPAAGAVALLGEAVQRLHTEGLPYDEARARLSLAEALRSVGDTAAACHHLARATEVLTALSAERELDRAHRLEAVLRDDPASGIGPSAVTGAGVSAPGPVTDSPLSSRETEVLVLVAQGLSNHDIAARLVLSEHTVHRHVANILVKLDQTSRTGAAAHALRAGLL